MITNIINTKEILKSKDTFKDVLKSYGIEKRMILDNGKETEFNLSLSDKEVEFILSDYFNSDLNLESKCADELRKIMVFYLFSRGLNRPNVDEIYKIMETFYNLYSDYFISPASTKYHGDYDGGLIDHSLAVYYSALRIKCAYSEKPKDELPQLSKLFMLNPLPFLLHDLCKVNAYKETWGNGNRYGYNNDNVISFHGPESLDRIRKFIYCIEDPMLSERMNEIFGDRWSLAVSYHMGMCNMSNGDMSSYNNAINNYPEVLLMHHADMIASKIMKI